MRLRALACILAFALTSAGCDAARPPAPSQPAAEPSAVAIESLDEAPGAGGKAVTTHPRLWIRKADVSRIRSWAANNPLWRDGLALAARKAREEMDAGNVPGKDDGSVTWVEYPTESYAELFAFVSLVDPDASARADAARRARTLLMRAVGRAALGPAENQPFRDPDFSLDDRSRWWGEAWALTVDWIYPSLSSADTSLIRRVFLRWADEEMREGYHHPEPVGVTNEVSLVDGKEKVRWSANNYATAHMRNIGLMAMALDRADDPDGKLHKLLDVATGAHLYVVDRLMRTDSAGGLFPEGFEYSPQSMGYVAQFLLALHTAGEDDTARRGRQVRFSGNPFWNAVVPAYLHSISPVPVQHEWKGPVYQPAWYGDGQHYDAPDAIEAFGPLGIYSRLSGNRARYDAARWIETNLAPGGSGGLNKRVAEPEAFGHSILAYLLFDPTSAQAGDPRRGQPLTQFAPGIGRLLARTGWGTGARWFTYSLGWLTIDHQHADGNTIELYRKGEWLTKERTGYDLSLSEAHNTLAIENDRPDHHDPDDYRYPEWKRGSQWLYEATADGRILARVAGSEYVHATGDATGLYNSDYEGISGVSHASRSFVWLKPDVVVIYDRAETKTAGRFKRFWLNLPGNGSVSGNHTVARTPMGQKLVVTTLLPAGATPQVQLPPADEKEHVADGEPMTHRLLVEAPGGPQQARFLNVIEGTDGGASPKEVTLVQSSGGTPYSGARVGGVVVLFPITLGRSIDRVEYTAPAGATRQIVTGLAPGARYDVEVLPVAGGTRVVVRPGAAFTADAGGVLAVNARSA